MTLADYQKKFDLGHVFSRKDIKALLDECGELREPIECFRRFIRVSGFWSKEWTALFFTTIVFKLDSTAPGADDDILCWIEFRGTRVSRFTTAYKAEIDKMRANNGWSW